MRDVSFLVILNFLVNINYVKKEQNVETPTHRPLCKMLTLSKKHLQFLHNYVTFKLDIS